VQWLLVDYPLGSDATDDRNRTRMVYDRLMGCDGHLRLTEANADCCSRGCFHSRNEPTFLYYASGRSKAAV
jgi:hypothetical protein